MTMPARRSYTAAKPTVLAGNLTNSATTFTVADGSTFSTGSGGSFFVTVDGNTALEERILCSSRTGDTFTVASGGRGADGTTAVAHVAGADVFASFSALDADEANAHTSASASTGSVTVHGLASGSSVVGTTDTQTLSNKTYTIPYVDVSSSQTFSGFTKGNATVTSKYQQVGKRVHFWGQVTLGSTSVMTGPLDVTLPVTAVGGTLNFNSACSFPEDGSFIHWGTACHIGTTLLRLIVIFCPANGNARSSDVAATNPFTWATSDRFEWNHVYEAA